MTIGDTTYFATYTVRIASGGNTYIDLVVKNICPNQVFGKRRPTSTYPAFSFHARDAASETVFVDPMKINSRYEGFAECEMLAVYCFSPKNDLKFKVSSGTAWIEQSL
jgi:hypothetical protein